MTSDRTPTAAHDDMDIAALLRAVWERKLLLAGLVIGAGVAVMTVLTLMTPRYTSEAQILIDNDETAVTRPVNRSSSDRTTSRWAGSSMRFTVSPGSASMS